MRDLKLGILLGIIVVGVAIFFFVGREHQPSLEPEITPPPVQPTEPSAPAEPVKATPRPRPQREPAVTPVPPPAETPAAIKIEIPQEPTPAPVPPAVKPEPPVAKPSAEPQPPRQPRYYTVVKGDSLYQIAERYYGHGRFWTIIRDANRHLFRNDEDITLQPDWKLRIPYPDEIQE